MTLEHTLNLERISRFAGKGTTPFMSRLILIIRIFSIIAIGLYVAFLYDNAFPWSDVAPWPDYYTIKLVIWAFFEFSFYGMVGNFGLLFITTKKAKKHRLLATICYIPSILITPIIVGVYFLGYAGILTTFLASIFVYYYFNPWRNNG